MKVITTKLTDSQIYHSYLKAVENKTPISALASVVGVSRGHIYDVVRRLRDGNPRQVAIEVEKARQDALWKYKYQPRYDALRKDRTTGTIRELRAIIKGMRKDGFSQVIIAARLGKDRSTIIHHLGV